MNRRGQYGTEFLALVALVLLMLTPVLIYATQSFGLDSSYTEAEKTVASLSDAIAFVSSQGYPAKTSVIGTIPDNAIAGSSVENYTVVVNLDAPRGPVQITSETNVCGTGALPESPGTYTFYVMALKDGCVGVSYNTLQIVPPSVALTLPLNANSATSLSILNFHSPANLSMGVIGGVTPYLDLDPSLPGTQSNVSFPIDQVAVRNIAILPAPTGTYTGALLVSSPTHSNQAPVTLIVTPFDTWPPVLSNIRYDPLSPIHRQQVRVLWDTDELCNATVAYRSNAGPWNTATNTSFSLSQNVSIGYFYEGDLVQYYITSCDTSDNCMTNNNAGAYYTFTVGAPVLSDYGTWRLSFDPASDFNYKASGAWTIKAWLYDQNRTLTPGKTLRLTITRINDGAVSVNNQLMTDNGDGSYQYTATIPNPWNNDWAQIRILYDDPNNNLDMNYYRVVYVKSSAGNSDRPWKLEPDPTSTTTYLPNHENYTVKAWLYNAQNATMPGQDVRITVQNENGPVLINNQAMTNNGDGSYEYNITNGTLTIGTDYRIQTWVNKTISSRQYAAQYEYTAEAV